MKASDLHWVRKNPRGQQCLLPESIGLIPFKNSYGATIYRVKMKKSPVESQSNPYGHFLNEDS